MSQWQGPPQAWQQPYPQQEPGYGPGYGMPGYPPPPRTSNAGIFWALGIAGAVLLIAVVGGAVFLLTKGDGKSKQQAQAPAAQTTSAAPTETPTDTPTSRPPASTVAGVPNILKPTVKTAWGETYYRTQTRAGTCTSVANSGLKTALRAHPCVAPIASALYKSSDRSVSVTITIMKFASSADASAILHAADGKPQPSLIAQPRPGVGEWYYNHSQGPYVIFSYAVRSNGGAPGAKSGPVNVAAVHLGTELTNVMIWEN